MKDTFTQEVAGKSKVHAGAIHASDPAAGQALSDWIQESAAPQELVTAELSPVIGTHTGPGTVGIGFLTGP